MRMTMCTQSLDQSHKHTFRFCLTQEAAMSQLQRSCADIPALTTATAELHNQLTGFLLTSHTVPSAQPGLHPTTPAASSPYNTLPPYNTSSSSSSTGLGFSGGVPAPIPGYQSPARLPPGNPPRRPVLAWGDQPAVVRSPTQQQRQAGVVAFQGIMQQVGFVWF